MVAIVGLSGSLRRASFNAGLLRAAAAAAPLGSTVEGASMHGIPLYDADLEASPGNPPAVADLQERIKAADGLLLVTPEYNHSIPGVFKNAIDWLSSFATGGEEVFRDKPVGVIGASPNPHGTLNAQMAWEPVFRALSMKHWFEQTLFVKGARELFDDAGNLTDDATRLKLIAWLAGFCEFVAAETGHRQGNPEG